MKISVLNEVSIPEIMALKREIIPLSPMEIAWSQGEPKKSYGTKRSVTATVDNNGKLLCHTHPLSDDGEETPFTAIPSETDLVAATEAFENGVPGMVVFSHSGKYFMILKPTNNVSTNFNGYESSIKQSVANADMDIVLNKLRNFGFDVGFGER